MRTTPLRLIKFILLVGGIAGLILFWRFTTIGQQWTSLSQIPASQIPALVESVHQYAPWDRLLYIGIYILGTIILLPGTLLSFIGAVLFGAYEGTLYTWIGAVLGASCTFAIARWLGRDFVESILPGQLATLDQQLAQHGFRTLLIIRLLPIFPFNGVNFGAGLTTITFRDYVSATAIGILPGVFIYQILFAKLYQRILAEGFQRGLDWRLILDPQVFGAVGLFLAFLLMVSLAKKYLFPDHTKQAEKDTVGTISLETASRTDSNAEVRDKIE